MAPPCRPRQCHGPKTCGGTAVVAPHQIIAEPAANGVFVELPRPTAEALWAQGWHFYRFIGENGYRLMCSWATTSETVDRFIGALRAELG